MKDAAENPDDRLIELAQSLVGIEIEPHQWDGVVTHLEVARRLADLVEAAALDVEVENAPVFRP